MTPGFSLRHTEPTQGQNSGFSWNDGIDEGQQYSPRNPSDAHSGFNAFNSIHMDQNGALVSSRSQWNTSPAHAGPEQMTRQGSTHSQGAHLTSSYDQARSLRLYSVGSQVPFMSSARSEGAGRSSPVDPGLYTSAQQLDLPEFDNYPFPGSEDISVGHSTFHGDALNGLSHSRVSMTTGPQFNMLAATADEFASMPNGSNNMGSHVPVSHESVEFGPSTVISSISWINPVDPLNSPPTLWTDSAAFLESQRSSPEIDEWALPRSYTVTPASNSPMNSPPSLGDLSPRYIQDFPDMLELPPRTTSDRIMRKPVGPRQSKVASDLANREQRTPAISEASDDSLRFVGRSSLEIDNTARDHPLYQNVAPKADGLYHCPWEGKDSCTHKPEKLKCNYDKFVDSHLKPYKCKVVACENSRFSSTACLLRHEREAHAMHGHGDKPYLCTYEGCERGVSGNGFPRHWNLRDHMKRVHNDPGNSPPKTTGSPPPPNPPKSKKRKADAAEASPVQNVLKKVATPRSHPAQSVDPSLIDRYCQSEQKLQEVLKQLSDPRKATNMDLLRIANDCIKVMAQVTQRMQTTPATHLSQQQIG